VKLWFGLVGIEDQEEFDGCISTHGPWEYRMVISAEMVPRLVKESSLSGNLRVDEQDLRTCPITIYEIDRSSLNIFPVSFKHFVLCVNCSKENQGHPLPVQDISSRSAGDVPEILRKLRNTLPLSFQFF
jgi:hypothetical protein